MRSLAQLFTLVCLLTGFSNSAFSAQSTGRATSESKSSRTLKTLDEVATPAEIFAELLKLNPTLKAEMMGLRLKSKSQSRLVIEVDKSRFGQTMTVTLDGQELYNWKVSTGREEWEETPSGREYFSKTPVGEWRPTVLTRNHFSNTWETNMPYAVFFVGGIAIHGIKPSLNKKLGRRASGGCVRLQTENAKILFELIKSIGKESTLIRVVD